MGVIRLGNKPPLTVAAEDSVVHAATAMTHPSGPAQTFVEGDVTFCTYCAPAGPNYEFGFAVMTV